MRHLRLLLVCFCASSLAAQTYTAKTVTFNDHGDFTQQQLEDAAGIHTGTTFKAADLSAGAQHLVDTGYFDNVGASLDGKMSAVTVLFDIKPTPRTGMLHVAFENFVWLTPDEITTAIHARFPLFSGFLPDNSPHQDDIKAALTAALAAKSITAKVACETWEPTLHHPVRELGCAIESPTIRVANIKLGGTTAALVPLLQKSVNATARTRYTEGPADITTSERILAPLLDAGYIQAALSDITLTPTPASDGSIGVVIAAKLQPGEIYKLSTITFAGTPVISAQDFTATAKLHPGDIASHAALLETLAPIDAAYRRQGYMDVVVNAAPTLDAATQQVAYNISVVPGAQYRVKVLTPQNLDPAALADFNRGFLMKPGELYNPEYIETFTRRNTALQALAGYSAVYKAYADPNTHTVELVLSFVRSAR